MLTEKDVQKEPQGNGTKRNQRVPEGSQRNPREPKGSRSALGLVAIYDLLLESIVMCSDVSSFQSSLLGLVKDRAAKGCEDWAGKLNPRMPLASHPLVAYW